MQKRKALPQIVHHRSTHSKHLSQSSVFPASLIVTLIGGRPRGGGGGGGGGTFLGGTGGGSRVAVGAGLMGQRPHERLQEAAMKAAFRSHSPQSAQPAQLLCSSTQSEVSASPTAASKAAAACAPAASRSQCSVSRGSVRSSAGRRYGHYE